MRSLLHQMFQRRPDMIDICLPSHLRLAKDRPNFVPVWSREVLAEMLRLALRGQAAATRYCIFLDGLDEYEGDHYDLLEFLQAFENSSNVKICVSSREWNIFESSYGRRQANLQMRIQGVNLADIDTFVRGRFEEDVRFRSLLQTDARARELLQEICRCAEGVFLWVFLVTNSVRRDLSKGDTITDLNERLLSVPVDLGYLVRNIFDDIEPHYRKFAARTLLVLHQSHADGIHPIWVPLIEQDILGANFAINTPSQLASPLELYELLVSSAMSVKR